MNRIIQEKSKQEIAGDGEEQAQQKIINDF